MFHLQLGLMKGGQSIKCQCKILQLSGLFESRVSSVSNFQPQCQMSDKKIEKNPFMLTSGGSIKGRTRHASPPLLESKCQILKAEIHCNPPPHEGRKSQNQSPPPYVFRWIRHCSLQFHYPGHVTRLSGISDNHSGYQILEV